MTTTIHDSDTCAAGESLQCSRCKGLCFLSCGQCKCPTCRGAGTVAQPCEMCRRAREREITVKQAILDVIDEGKNGGYSWRFSVDPLTSEAEARENAQRLDFCDRVLARIKQLKRG